jgi:hypothetical protein
MVRTRIPCLLALLALLLLQQLGLVHRYAHAGSLQGTAPEVAAVRLLQAEPTGLPEHEAGACGLLDHLCIGDALSLPSLVMATGLLTAGHFLRLSRDFIARRTALFEARGPPAAC